MNEPALELAGRTALVTASSRGLGKHIAIGLARQGADVAVNYRSQKEAAEAVTDTIRSLGRRAWTIQGDVTEPETCRGLVKETIDRLGRCDILINNAGEFAYKKTRDHTDDEYERIIKSTIGATYYCSMAALTWMRSQGWGRIVNLGAAAAERAGGRKNIGPHLAGKAAVVSLTRTLAVEEGPNGITVNVVSPGVVRDRELSREDAVTMEDDQAPVRRPGTKDDVVDAVLYCTSPRSGFLNGAVIAVTGGWQI